MPTAYPSVLAGDGDNDYERYMRTVALLALQRRPEEVSHRDELLFQVVHQCTELLLKVACSELREAARLLRADHPDSAARLVRRAAEYAQEITGLLDLLRHLNPRDFQVMRISLGNGSGLQSPGWQAARAASIDLGQAFAECVADDQVVALYTNGEDTPLHRLAEAMIEWDERVSIWRVRHFKLAARIIGHSGIGTRGTPVEALRQLIGQYLFPALWSARDALAALSDPAGEAPAVG